MSRSYNDVRELVAEHITYFLQARGLDHGPISWKPKRNDPGWDRLRIGTIYQAAVNLDSLSEASDDEYPNRIAAVVAEAVKGYARSIDDLDQGKADGERSD